MGKLSSRDRKLAHAAGQNVSVIENAQFATLSTSASQTLLQGPLPVVPATGMLMISGTVYWSYIGYTQKQLVVDYVRWVQTVAAAGTTQAGEVYLASTTAAPDAAAKTLTVLYANSTLDDIKTGTYTDGLIKGNASAAAFTVSPCVHLWAAARFAMSGTPTQPTLLGVNLDLSQGQVLVTTGQSVLTVGATATGALLTQGIGATAIHPLLRLQVKA